jgi:hypothetical protein
MLGHRRSQNVVTSFRLCQAIHVEVTLAALPPALARRTSAWTTRSKPGGDESESVAWHDSDAAT